MTVEFFQGIPCEQRPLDEWEHWVCSHLRPLVNPPGSGQPSEISKILISCNRSTEIFIFATGSVPDAAFLASVNVPDQLRIGQSCVSCDTCWSSLYAASAA